MKLINNTLNLQFNKLNLKFGLKHTFLFLLSFAINWYLFGLQNISLVGAVITSFYFVIPNKNIKVKSLSKVPYIYLTIILVTFLGSLATTNLVLSLLLNLLVPFVIVCIFSDETNISGYRLHYSMFIFMQCFYITLDIFKFHLLSAFIGLIIGYIFEEVVWSKNYININSDILEFKEYFIINLKSNYIKLIYGLNLDSLISRFAVRLSIATAFSFILWKYLNLPKWYWLSMSTCYTLVPICNQINSRAFKRIQGTIIGAIVFLVFSFLVRNPYISVILIVLSVLLMLAYLPHSRLTEYYAFSTYIALSFSIVSLSSITATSYRLLYVLVGAFMAVVFNKLILPNKSENLCEQE